jgi:hypothetical protein
MELTSCRNELAQNARRIQALVEAAPQSEACIRPAPGSWSILEVIAHLLDEEREDFRVILKLILRGEGPGWPDLDPRGWVESRQYNQRELRETLNAFLHERETSLVWLDGLSGADWDTAYPAPFGTVQAGDILAAWVAHDLLHMRQLVELHWARVIRLSEPYSVAYAGEW